MYEERYIKEKQIVEKTKEESDLELIKSVIRTKKDLELANRNFEFAEAELIDYYAYQIKANQAKLDYLLKKVKIRGLVLENIKERKIRLEDMDEVG